jgi:hypothetical protein
VISATFEDALWAEDQADSCTLEHPPCSGERQQLRLTSRHHCGDLVFAASTKELRNESRVLSTWEDEPIGLHHEIEARGETRVGCRKELYLLPGESPKEGERGQAVSIGDQDSR